LFNIKAVLDQRHSNEDIKQQQQMLMQFGTQFRHSFALIILKPGQIDAFFALQLGYIQFNNAFSITYYRQECLPSQFLLPVTLLMNVPRKACYQIFAYCLLV
jgi:hypothetical protein